MKQKMKTKITVEEAKSFLEKESKQGNNIAKVYLELLKNSPPEVQKKWFKYIADLNNKLVPIFEDAMKHNS